MLLDTPLPLICAGPYSATSSVAAGSPPGDQLPPLPHVPAAMPDQVLMAMSVFVPGFVNDVHGLGPNRQDYEIDVILKLRRAAVHASECALPRPRGRPRARRRPGCSPAARPGSARWRR